MFGAQNRALRIKISEHGTGCRFPEYTRLCFAINAVVSHYLDHINGRTKRLVIGDHHIETDRILESKEQTYIGRTYFLNIIWNVRKYITDNPVDLTCFDYQFKLPEEIMQETLLANPIDDMEDDDQGFIQKDARPHYD